MPFLTHNFDINDLVWVVDPVGPALFHGTVIKVDMTGYNDTDGTEVTKVNYVILLDDDYGTLVSTEEYMDYDQADAILILADLIDSMACG